MIQKTFEIAIALILVVTTLAFSLATTGFMIVGFAYVTQQSFGALQNLVITLFMMAVTLLVFMGNVKLFRAHTGLNDEGELEEEKGFRPRLLQATKKGSTSSN